MKLSLTAGMVAGLLLFAAPAIAAPVTVDLRIEGPTKTLYEGRVTTDTRPFVADDGPHACGAVPTRGAAIAAAIQQAPLAVSSSWSAALGNPSFNTIAGESVAFDAGTGKFLGEFKNNQFASVGACDDAISEGDNVLFAYTDGAEPLLALSAPTQVKLGETATVTVTDAGTGAPIAGATVEGATTGADGKAAVGPWTTRGLVALKASKPGTVRSNRASVCASDTVGCGVEQCACAPTPLPAPPVVVAPDRTAPTATLTGLRDKQTLRRGPRELRGSFADTSGVKAVKLRLTKRLGKKCWYFSGKTERFRGTKCGRGAVLRDR